MKNNIYLKSTFTDIRQSFGRFISIILIILIGVLLFVGIKSIGPNLEKTATNYFEETHLSDLQIISTMGLTTEDKELVEQLEGANVELGYRFPYLEETNQLSIQIYSYQGDQLQNRLILKNGRMATNGSEVVIDEILADYFEIGDKITIDHDQLSATEFEVVGYVDSPLYVDNKERGVTTIGNGQIDGFIYIPESAFDSDIYSIMYVTFDSLETKDYFSDGYTDDLEGKMNQLEELFKTRKMDRKAELQASAMEELVEQEQIIGENETTLVDAQSQLNMAKEQLEVQKEQLGVQKAQLVAQYGEEVAEQQLAGATFQLGEAEEQLLKQEQELDEMQATLNDAKEQIAAAKVEIEEMATPNYMLNDRSNNAGFTEYASLSERIDAIANVFPVFFFFIAILITFTTMTRMIEENRKEIGTLKALGYRNHEIVSKYMLYAILAAFIGTSIGVILGTKFLPTVVFSMLKEQYIFSDYTTHFFGFPITIAIIAALIATLGSSMLVLTRDLQEKTTALLMPKAPKSGKRVFLEKVTPIWSRLNFHQKVTYRNLFRYKARMILTILGIAGCTGLMIAGFGLQDSISAPADKQFNELIHYQAILTLDEGAVANDYNEVQQVLSNEEKMINYLPIHSEQVSFREKGIANQTATLLVIDSESEIGDYFSFNGTTKDSSTELGNEGVIITERLSKIYGVGVDETLTMLDNAGEEYEFKIAGIVENYLGHSIYMSTDYYQMLTENEASPNAYLVKSEAMTKNQEDTLSEKLLETNEVLNTTFISNLIEKQEAATGNLGSIVLILIVLSGTLAFVVLYNLTNINISERERELATMKVLGFFEKEVTLHIVRENVIFTIFGILFGLLVGRVLTWFILEMASSDLINFPLIIKWQGNVISAIMTCIFSVIIMLITHHQLKRIHMIEALKSNE